MSPARARPPPVPALPFRPWARTLQALKHGAVPARRLRCPLGTPRPCAVIDASGTRWLSRRVDNDETVLLKLIADVLQLSEGDPVTWAIDLNADGAALMTDNGRQVLYIPGCIIHHASGSYRATASPSTCAGARDLQQAVTASVGPSPRTREAQQATWVSSSAAGTRSNVTSHLQEVTLPSLTLFQPQSDLTVRPVPGPSHETD
ncbi:IS110 family transposase [Streptomyces sp. NPDC001312]|uniref:IS110 family transposase n=1 Tax=Streptomyces sp. NPDC001312 TaxID=3364561 RepID=UPI00369E286C